MKIKLETNPKYKELEVHICHSVAKELEKIKPISNISPQETSVAPNLTVLENLEFMAQIYGMSKKETEEKTGEIVEKFSLNQVKNSKAKTLSVYWHVFPLPCYS